MDKLSQATKIYRLIRSQNKHGTPNYQLARVCLNYTMRVSELRKDGHNVQAERQYKNGRATGVWLYFLNEEGSANDAA